MLGMELERLGAQYKRLILGEENAVPTKELSKEQVAQVEQVCAQIVRVAETARADLKVWEVKKADQIPDKSVFIESPAVVRHCKLIAKNLGLDDPPTGRVIGMVAGFLQAATERAGSAVSGLAAASGAVDALVHYYNETICLGAMHRGYRISNQWRSSSEPVELSGDVVTETNAAAFALFGLAVRDHERLDAYLRAMISGVDVLLEHSYSTSVRTLYRDLFACFDEQAPSASPQHLARACDLLSSLSVRVPAELRRVVESAGDEVSMLRHEHDRSQNTCTELVEMCAGGGE